MIIARRFTHHHRLGPLATFQGSRVDLGIEIVFRERYPGDPDADASGSDGRMIVLTHTSRDRENLLESRFHRGVGPWTRTGIGPLRPGAGRERDEQCDRPPHHFTSGVTTRLRNSTA